MRIVFFGSGEFGLPTLQALSASHDVALVVSQPDRPAGRHRQLTPTPIAQWAAERGLPLIKPANVNRDDVPQQIARIAADAHVVVAFGQKVGRALIEMPRLGPVATMNLHASLLPKYRGAAPINWAIVRGQAATGNTVFALVDRMDAGDILGTQSTPIGRRETAGELHDRLAAMGPDVVLDMLDRLGRGALTPQPQDESQATLAPKLSKADGVIDFSAPAEELRCRINGLTPWPGVSCAFSRGGGATPQPLLLRRADSIADGVHTGPPGALLDPVGGLIAAGVGAVQVLEVQPPGKRLMNWTDFQRGHPLPRGAMFCAAPLG